VTNSNLILGKVIADLRHSAGISQEELAERAGIHRTYVSQLERGLKSPTVSILERVAAALNTRASAILLKIEKVHRREI
jgi:transcriptional regulator with XRE-family HTH domain